MYSLVLRFLFICGAAHVVSTGRDFSVCKEVTQSCGLVPPHLPDNFESKGEHVDYVKQVISFQELYYDKLNLIGKFVETIQGNQLVYIFDYLNDQVTEYMVAHVGLANKYQPLLIACLSRPLQSSRLKYIFGYKMANREIKNTHMFNTYEVLRFGGEHKYRSNGTDNLDDRGLQANKFSGCVYDSVTNATLAINYYFSTNRDLTPTTSLDSLSFDYVPVQVNVDGVVDINNVTFPVKAQSSISWFKSNPDFKYDTFKIPQGLYCDSYRGEKQMPDFPTAFSTRLERSSFTQDANGQVIDMAYRYQEIWYNVRTGLARNDFTPEVGLHSEIYNKFGNKNLVKSIYDFNTGIVYFTNKATGNCFARSIIPNDFFETSKESMYIAMASPEEIFYMDSDVIEYKGKDIVRNIETDVWSGKYYDAAMNMTSFLETYITTNGWFEESDELLQYRVPVRHTVTSVKMDNRKFYETIDESNFFKFKGTAPPLLMFDIYRDGCYDDIEKAWMGIKLSGDAGQMDIIQKYKFYFTEALQLYIADIAQVGTPLRVQRVNVRKVQNDNMIVFNLLEKTKIKVNVPEPRIGVNLKRAINYLAEYIEAGNFTVIFKDANDEEQIIKVNPGSLGQFKIKTTFAQDQDIEIDSIHFSPRPKRNSNFVYFADNASPTRRNVIKGMSPGGLAGLSITMLIIGIAVGIGLMYQYIKRYMDQGAQEYQMK